MKFARDLNVAIADAIPLRQTPHSVSLPISQSAILIPQGKRADGAHPQTGRTGRALRIPHSALATDSFPVFILGWMKTASDDS